MQTDFAGYRPEGIEEGKLRKFELFVAALPASHYLFSIITRSQSTNHLEIELHRFLSHRFIASPTEIQPPTNKRAERSPAGYVLVLAMPAHLSFCGEEVRWPIARRWVQCPLSQEAARR
jgi:hypothetical protein